MHDSAWVSRYLWLAIWGNKVVGGFRGKTGTRKGGRNRSTERWVVNLREILGRLRISVPKLLKEVVGEDGKGREHLRKICYGTVPAPLNPKSIIEQLAAGIAKLTPMSENRDLEAKEILRQILAGTPYEVKGLGDKEVTRDHTTINRMERQYPGTNLPAQPFLLRVDYDDAHFRDQLERSERLSMTGANLRRHDARRKDITNFVLKGGSVAALLVDPQSLACKYSAFQEHGNDKPPAIAKFKRHVRSAYDWLCELKTMENNKYVDKITIKKIAYPLCFGIDIMERREVSGVSFGVAYIRFYPLMLDESEKDRPIIEISHQNPLWFDFFNSQLDRHFSRAKPWPCSKGPKNKRRD